MNRRAFFSSMIGGVAATAAVRTWPFRVFSFPKEIVVPVFSYESRIASSEFDQITAVTLAHLREDILYDNFFIDTPFLKKIRKMDTLERIPYSLDQGLTWR